MNKNTRNYLIILVVLVLLFLIWPKKERSNEKIKMVAHKSKVDKVTFIKLSKNFVNFAVENKVGTKDWKITYKGNADQPVSLTALLPKVNSLINIFTADISLELISKKRNLYASYGLDDENKMMIKAYSQGQVVRELVVGRAVQGYHGVYVLQENKIYRLPLNKEITFTLTLEDLVSKSIFSFIVGNVDTITLQKGTEGKKLALVKNQETNDTFIWQNLENKKQEYPQNEVNDFLLQLASLNCDDFLVNDPANFDNLTNKANTKSTWSMVLTAANGTEIYKLLLLSEKEEGVHAVSSTADYKFVLSKETHEAIIKPLEKLYSKKSN